MAIFAPLFPVSALSIPLSHPVIPAKAGIQRGAGLRSGSAGVSPAKVALILDFSHKRLAGVGFALKFGYAKAALARGAPPS